MQKIGCSCPYFQKNHKCKHLLGLSHSKGLDGEEISDATKKIPLNQKVTRGRPEKAKPAPSRHHANNGNLLTYLLFIFLYDKFNDLIILYYTNLMFCFF